jgi:tetratricopeptide (TPR) repeat protein
MRRCLAFLALSLLATSALAIEPPREKERWTTLTIDELTIYSNASDATTRDVASGLLRLRDALSAVTKFKVRSPLPTRVFIFGDQRGFVPYCDAAIGRSDRLTGLFLSHPEGNHLLIDGSAHSVDRVVYHELTHYFLRNTIPGDVPLWFNEGLAEFYSTFRQRNNAVEIGLPVEEHVDWLRTQTLIPLKDLLAINRQSREYHEADRQGVFYAESWALVHYLMIGSPERRDQLGTYVGLIQGGQTIDNAFRIAFHGTYDDLERELRKYIRAFSMKYIRYTLADFKAKEVPAPQPLARDVLLVGLGDLLLNALTPHFGEAETFLSAAIKANPSNADAYAEMGVARAWQRDNVQAETYFEKAVQLGSRSATPYLLYGDSILRRLDAGLRHDEAAPQAEVAKARDLFRKATELDPQSATAFSGLGATYAWTTDDPAPGIAALERSLALAPSEIGTIFNLIVIECRAGRRDDAARHLEALSHLADAETVRQARENLYIADLNRANALGSDGKHAEAAEIMKRVAAQTTNEQLRTDVTAQVALIDRADAADVQSTNFQHAVEAANSGRFKEALAMIDELLPKITEPEMLAAARDFRAKVTEYIAKPTPKKKK